jgi:hypothetical protein
MRSFKQKINLPLSATLLILLLTLGCQQNIQPLSATDVLGSASISAQISRTSGGFSTTESSKNGLAPTYNGSGTPPSTTPPMSAEALTATAEFDWRDVPVMPEINKRVFEIYRNGQDQGRNPHNFSVIGDCQAIPYVFLGPFERGEQQPDSSEGYLWDAVRQFKGSFSRNGMAVRGGFNAASILSPLQADPHFCLSGETPLTCEYRLQNPSIVFIMLETWLDPSTINRYEDYLRQILDYVIAKGTVPILMTKADMAEMGNGVPVINPAIVRLALEYEVPLINFWRSAQSLDNGGIDPNREGFHLSPEGFKLKNILALRALYKVWTQVEKGEISSDATSVPGNPTATATLAAISTSQSGWQLNIPDCDGGCIFAGTAVSHDGAITSHGVLAINYLTQQVTQVLGDGFDLQDVSEDGRRLLVNNAANLYEINLGDASITPISDSFFSFGKQGAYWNGDDSQVVYLDLDQPIQTEAGVAFNLFPSSRDGDIYFESGSCTGKANCQSGGVYHLDANQRVTRLDSYSQMVFSPDGKRAAFLDPTAATKENYFHIPYMLLEDVDQGIRSRKSFYFPGEKGFMVNPDVRNYAFSSDNDKLFILYDVYSDYYERSLSLQLYGYDIPTRAFSDFGEIVGSSGSQNPRLVWAPQETKVLLFLTDVTADNQYSMSLYQADLETDVAVKPFAPGIIISDEYFYISNLFWR